LIAVTGGAALAAFRTLAQIKKQVIANSDEAAAAKMNAEAILLAERAYVKLSHEQKAWSSSTGRLDFVRLNDEITQVWFRHRIQNRGKTPCDALGGHLWIFDDTTLHLNYDEEIDTSGNRKRG
jgi:hypothetical protein